VTENIVILCDKTNHSIIVSMSVATLSLLNGGDSALDSILRKMGYALTGAFVIGLAAYAGYRAATPQKYLVTNRHPESNDQVRVPFS
ncbi:unnamed protein product, partial [Didymodactylos carnosus]